MMEIIIVIALGSAVAGFVQGFAGFGFGLASLAIWSWVVEPSVAVPAVVWGSLVGQVLAIPSMRNSFNWPRLWPFLLGGCIGVPIGLYLLQHMEPLYFKFGIGLLLTLYCGALLCLNRLPRITHGGRVADSVIGSIGGLMGGFGGVPAPVPTLWCALRGWTKDQQRSVFQTFNLVMHASTLTGFWISGLITGEVLELFMIVTPIMIIPTLIGIRLYRRVTDNSFRMILLSLLMLSGCAMLVATTGEVVKRVL